MITRRDFLRGGFARRFRADVAKGGAQVVHRSTQVVSDLRALRYPRTSTDVAAPGPRGSIPVLRPPGAIREDLFLARCTRCTDCASACPYQAIRPAPIQFREAAGTPRIDPSEQPCWNCPDTPCVNACQTGALSATLGPAMGTALIQEQTCLAHQGGFCSSCVERCPVEGAIEVTDGRPRVVEAACTGCGVCHYVCPAPENAVMILPAFVRPVPRTSASAEPFRPGQPAPDRSAVNGPGME